MRTACPPPIAREFGDQGARSELLQTLDGEILAIEIRRMRAAR